MIYKKRISTTINRLNKTVKKKTKLYEEMRNFKI